MEFQIPKGWKAVIGLEIHAQLNTESKMFSSDSAQFGSEENSHVSPLSMGLPGALPVLNKKALEYSIKSGLALGCKISNHSIFARKHYFYPDLPKGYQISQYEFPLCFEGQVNFFVEGEKKSVRIERAHMEEDAGKSIHEDHQSFINYNRSGIPLLEIVSGPDMSRPKEAAEYAKTVRNILQYLEVCDGNLEEGSLRCDCNVSVMKENEEEFRDRVEVKNINSFRFIEKALEYEILRQINVYDDGGTILQETRLFDSAKSKTFPMRKKEKAMDYRYFPDPDLLPVVFDEKWVSDIKSQLPELPLERAQRLVDEMNIPIYDAHILTQDKKMADYFEQVAISCGAPKMASNWIMGELLGRLNEDKKGFSENPIEKENLSELIVCIKDQTISGKIAKQVFQFMWETQRSPREIIKEKGWSQIIDPVEIQNIVQKVIEAHPEQVQQYLLGKRKVFGFFVGQVMKESKGQAHPELVNSILKDKLKKECL